jgi:ABC-type glycerol-3-phosphate transport system substrate-binding protein
MDISRGARRTERPSSMGKGARATRRAVCASATLVPLVGCGPWQQPGTAAPGKAATGKVTFWPEGAGGPWDEFWPKVDSAFRDAFPSVQYTREIRPSRQGQAFLQVLVASAAAGSAPDVYQDDVVLNRLQVTVQAGIPRAVDDLYARMPNLRKIFPWTRNVAQLRGKYWGIPHEVEFVSMFYNKAALERANARSDPQTWDDFTRVSRTLSIGGTLPMLIGNIGGYRHLHGYLMAAYVGKEGMDEIRAGKARWDSGGCVDAAQLMVDLSATGILPQDPFDPAWSMPADFYNGNAAQTATGTWAIANYELAKRQSPGFDFGQYPIPSPRRGLKPQLCGGIGGGFSITTQATAPDACAAFIDFLYSPPLQTRWIEDVFRIPPIPFKVEDFTVAPGNRVALELIRQFEQSGIAAAFWMVQTARQFDEYGDLVERVLKKQITPKEMGMRMQQLRDENKPE